MDKNYLLPSAAAKRLYEKVRLLPIADYHCHLSPKEIYDDVPFDNIGEMWLGGDHYKWRLMRAAGVDEKYITGNASWHDKFIKYAEAVTFAAGSPLYAWSHMELSQFFGVEDILSVENAETIWEKANTVIREKQLSPRKLIEMSNVEYIATTDDPIDSLEYHRLIADDSSFSVKVAPAFRTDRLMLIRAADYPQYIEMLSSASGVKINSVSSLSEAISHRLDYFCSLGCRFSDVGIQYFPDRISDMAEADSTFKKAISGNEISDSEFMGFLGYMYILLASEYKKRGIVMQLHLMVRRNANTELFRSVGADAGGDCIGDTISCRDLTYILDAINSASGMPETILYTLEPSVSAKLVSIAGSFPNVRCGAAWWFCDHKRGIEEQILNIAECGHLGTFLGMLTDSRSFLSYARHDYFRRILCGLLGSFVESGEYPDEALAGKLAEKICIGNIRKLIEKGESR